jgi:hypothetical protein
MLGEANRDLALRAVKLRLRFDHIEGSVQRARARCVPGPLVVLLTQPCTKAFAANRPGFPVTVDDEIGIGGAVGRVEEPGGGCDIQQDIGAAHGVRPSPAGLLATWSERASLVPLEVEAIGRAFGRAAGVACSRSWGSLSRLCLQS